MPTAGRTFDSVARSTSRQFLFLSGLGIPVGTVSSLGMELGRLCISSPKNTSWAQIYGEEIHIWLFLWGSLHIYHHSI